jgi:hypothetical protein
MAPFPLIPLDKRPYYFVIKSSSIVKWVVRFNIGVARPNEAARNLFHIAPPSAKIREI